MGCIIHNDYISGVHDQLCRLIVEHMELESPPFRS